LMMRDLSMHVLDLIENSASAGAKRITVEVFEDHSSGYLEIAVKDDGCGMSEEEACKALDPFYTGRKKRIGVGLGLPLLRASAEHCAGSFELNSRPGEGTEVRARFSLDHVDRPPLGDLVSTLMVGICAHRDVDFRFVRRVDSEEFVLDTSEIREELGDELYDHPEVLSLLRRSLEEIERLASEARVKASGSIHV